MTVGPPLDVSIPLTSLDGDERSISFAQAAESGEYAYVSMPEVTGPSAVAVQGALAAATENIGITNDVMSPLVRSPTLLGQTAAALQQLSGGRYRLGLGASSPALVKQWHGRSFDRPLRTLREAIEIINTVLAGERVDYSGEIFDLGGLEPEFAAVEPKPPIDVASLGPKSVEMTGRFADGWVPQLFTPTGLEQRLNDLKYGAELAGRSLADIRVTPTYRCCVLSDRERARSLARRHLVFMLTAYGPYYRESVARQGWGDVTEQIYAKWHEGDKAGANEALPDDLMDSLVGAGTPEEVRERIRQFTDIDAVDAVRISFVSGQELEELEQTRDELAPTNW